MSSSRCAVCKYFRRRCPPDCVFAPYFPNNDPQRFTCVHQIYGASNIGKMLQEMPLNLRADAVESLYYEATCRIQDPVYGCVKMISFLHEQIEKAQSQLARAQAEIDILDANIAQITPSHGEPVARVDYYGLEDHSCYWF